MKLTCEESTALLLALDRDPAGQAALDAHLFHCAACRELNDAALSVDAELSQSFAGMILTPTPTRQTVPQPRPQVSMLPELLDAVGLTATVAALAPLFLWIWRANGWQLASTPLLLVAATALLALTAWLSHRALAELER